MEMHGQTTFLSDNKFNKTTSILHDKKKNTSSWPHNHIFQNEYFYW